MINTTIPRNVLTQLAIAGLALFGTITSFTATASSAQALSPAGYHQMQPSAAALAEAPARLDVFV